MHHKSHTTKGHTVSATKNGTSPGSQTNGQTESPIITGDQESGIDGLRPHQEEEEEDEEDLEEDYIGIHRKNRYQ